MAFSTSWDVEKYKSEFESDEHWQLRKQFILAHKNEFPEDKLVCLARVFCNIEFLGCRYPEKTMKLVEELSKGVADEFREKQKEKLKRTFVRASDAAEARAKGRGATQPDRVLEGPPSKQPKLNNSDSNVKYSCVLHESLLYSGEFPGFIIYESCKVTCPINTLTQSAQKSKNWDKVTFEFPQEKNPPGQNEKYCEVYLDNKFLASGVGATQKAAKNIAATEALSKLRKTCYTIQEKRSFFSELEVVSKEQLEKKKNEPVTLPQDNVGSRMMMKMGWAGAGLGKNQQGIQAPIEAHQTMRRAGFGHLSTPQFQEKFKSMFKDYIESGTSNDLVFAPDFSNEERKTLHRSAEQIENINEEKGKSVKQIDEDSEDDLFSVDSDGNMILPIQSDEENERDSEEPDADNQSCEVCCRLESLTGEESDDELFDRMWGTGSDTTGLVNILEDIQLSNKNIEDKSGSIETDQNPNRENKILETHLPKDPFHQSQTDGLSWQGEEKTPILPKAADDSDSLLHSRVSAVVSGLNQKLEKRAMERQISRTSSYPPTSYLIHNFSNLPFLKRFKIYLPDGSFKRFHRGALIRHPELLRYIYENRDGPWWSKLTYEDLLYNKALRDIFPEFASKLNALPGEDSNLRKSTVGMEFKNNFSQRNELTENNKIEDSNEKDTLHPPQNSFPNDNEDRTKFESAQTSQQDQYVVCDMDIESELTDEERNVQPVIAYHPEEKITTKERNVQPFVDHTEKKITTEERNVQPVVVTQTEQKMTTEERNVQPVVVTQTEQNIITEERNVQPVVVNQTEQNITTEERNVQPVAVNQTEQKITSGGRGGRILMILSDGSTVRINSKVIQSNKYFIRHDRRLNTSLLNPENLSPPEYSDSSSDELETEWMSKNDLFISEPEDCKVDKMHLLRRNWEQFIIKFGSSKRNPFAERWRNFAENYSSDKKKYLCEMWKKFVEIYNPYESERIPTSILQPAHELVALTQNTKPVSIQPCVPSKEDPLLTTVYLSNTGKMKIPHYLISKSDSWTYNKPSNISHLYTFKEKFAKLFCQPCEPSCAEMKGDLDKEVSSENETSKLIENASSDNASESNITYNYALHRNKRFRIILPDGSFKRFHQSALTKHKVLIPYAVNTPESPRKRVTYHDLMTNKELRDLFPEISSKLFRGQQIEKVFKFDRQTKGQSNETNSNSSNTKIQTVSSDQATPVSHKVSDGNTESEGKMPQTEERSKILNLNVNSSLVENSEVSLETRLELSSTDGVVSGTIQKNSPEFDRGKGSLTTGLAPNQTVQETLLLNLKTKPSSDDELPLATRLTLTKKSKVGATSNIQTIRPGINECGITHSTQPVTTNPQTDSSVVKDDELPLQTRWELTQTVQKGLTQNSHITSSELNNEDMPLETRWTMAQTAGVSGSIIQTNDGGIDEEPVQTAQISLLSSLKMSSSELNDDELPLETRWKLAQTDEVCMIPNNEEKCFETKSGRTSLKTGWEISQTSEGSEPSNILTNPTENLDYEMMLESHSVQRALPPNLQPESSNLSYDKFPFETMLASTQTSDATTIPSLPPCSPQCEDEATLENTWDSVQTVGENVLPNVQNNNSEVNEDVSLETSRESCNSHEVSFLQQAHEYLGEDEETSEKDIRSPLPRKIAHWPSRKRKRRVRLTLSDGSSIRLKKPALYWNDYVVRQRNQYESLLKGLISPDEYPPPYYSDSSTDEEESDWITKYRVRITEPEDCELDKYHVLRKNWERFILTIGSSKRNPLGKKWRAFLERTQSDQGKTLCQRWKDFLTITVPHNRANIPDTILEEAHKTSSSFSQSRIDNSNLSSESKVDYDLLKHLQQSTVCTSQSDLERHINSCDLTVVHSSCDSSIESHINSADLTVVHSMCDSPTPPPVVSKRVKCKKEKNPRLLTAYQGDGTKIKFFRLLMQK